MIQFLLKGLLRDRHRSLFPVLIVTGGVAITVLIYCYLLGFADDTIRTNAKLDTGHVKIMTRAYAEIASQVPNDLAFSDVSKLKASLKQDYPELDWAARIKFGGLLDIPDEEGETRAQGPVFGIALDLFNPDSGERKRFNLEDALVSGRLPQSPGEILVSEEFAGNLDVKIGEMATLISATANGSMAIQNFTLVGTIRFGIGPMDNNAMLADISDIRYALDMEDGAAEILGYFPNMIYKEEVAYKLAEEFNSRHTDAEDEFSPIMFTLSEQNNLGELLNMMNYELFIIIFIFIFVMSIVLWNTGLMSGIRRYGEIGIRLAIGESKSGVYLSMIYESVLIGCIGTVIGTAIGLGFSYYMQEVGIDFSSLMKGSNMLMSSVFRSRITPPAFYIGFVPGLLATVFGSLISGIGIFKRQTSQLFKELET